MLVNLCMYSFLCVPKVLYTMVFRNNSKPCGKILLR